MASLMVIRRARTTSSLTSFLKVRPFTIFPHSIPFLKTLSTFAAPDNFQAPPQQLYDQGFPQNPSNSQWATLHPQNYPQNGNPNQMNHPNQSNNFAQSLPPPLRYPNQAPNCSPPGNTNNQWDGQNQGYPQQGYAYPYQNQGYTPQRNQGYPQQNQGYTPQPNQGFPQQNQGYTPQQNYWQNVGQQKQDYPPNLSSGPNNWPPRTDQRQLYPPRAPNIPNQNYLPQIVNQGWGNPQQRVLPGQNAAPSTYDLLVLCHEGKVKDAIQLLDQGLRADSECFSALFGLCGNSNLEDAKKVHYYFLRSTYRNDLQLIHKVIDMFSKCGSIWIEETPLADRMIVVGVLGNPTQWNNTQNNTYFNQGNNSNQLNYPNQSNNFAQSPPSPLPRYPIQAPNYSPLGNTNNQGDGKDQGYPQQGYARQNQGYTPQPNQGYPQQNQGYTPPPNQGYPQQNQGYTPQLKQDYPQQNQGHTPQPEQGYPLQNQVYTPQQKQGYSPNLSSDPNNWPPRTDQRQQYPPQTSDIPNQELKNFQSQRVNQGWDLQTPDIPDQEQENYQPQRVNQGLDNPQQRVLLLPGQEIENQGKAVSNEAPSDAPSTYDLLVLCREGNVKDAIQLLDQGVHADAECFGALFELCGNSEELEDAKKVHDYFLKSTHRSNLKLIEKVIDMFSKCGSIWIEHMN